MRGSCRRGSSPSRSPRAPVPGSSSIEGPTQVFARLNQDESFSSQRTLLSQGGSDVVFGDFLVIPVADSFLYVQPVYVIADQESAIPELKIVVRHGGEPWTKLMVKLLLKWPNLYYSTSAFAPKHYPPDIVEFANTRGADKVMYAGYFSAGLGLDRIFAELPGVPFRDHVWPKFLRENAMRVFGLDEPARP